MDLHWEGVEGGQVSEETLLCVNVECVGKGDALYLDNDAGGQWRPKLFFILESPHLSKNLRELIIVDNSALLP